MKKYIQAFLQKYEIYIPQIAVVMQRSVIRHSRQGQQLATTGNERESQMNADMYGSKWISHRALGNYQNMQ